jgi:hypothetical protein
VEGPDVALAEWRAELVHETSGSAARSVIAPSIADELMSDTEDVDRVTRIIALISALQHGEPLRRALAQVGLTMETFQALNNQLASRMGEAPELAEEYSARLEAHQKALMMETLAAGGRAPTNVDLRDWAVVMRIEEKMAEARQAADRYLAESRLRQALSPEALRAQIEARLRAPVDADPQEFLVNASLVWVDWRDDAADLLGYFAGYFPDGELRVSGNQTIAIRFRGRRTTMKRREDPGDKHRALLALVRVLEPEFEMRLAADSLGGDTLAFAVLPTSAWRDLEQAHREAVARAFHVIRKGRDLWDLATGDASRSSD